MTNAITRRNAIKTLTGSAAALSMSALNMAHAQASQRPPNIILIFTDDQGYGDLSCYGSETIHTPYIDRMAEEGMKFESFYVCAAVCTPSRAGLLTGRQPMRSGLTQVLFPYSLSGIDDTEITVAAALKQQGYAAHCVGKWHLGHLPTHLPTRNGFDHYFGIPYSNDMRVVRRGDPPIPLMRDERIIEQPVDQRFLTQRFTDEAVRFIRENKDNPFFLYVPHVMPHIPLYVAPEFRGRSDGGLYGDVIEEIDWSTGRILQELKNQGIDDDTLVIFTSDNGPWLVMGDHGGSSGPLRHGKGTLFEGGVRVPCVARWPGKIEAGRVESRPASTLDLFPTFVNLAGGETPQDRPYDGYDITGVFLGTGAREDEEFYFYHNRELRAYRSGPWKIIKPFQGNVYGEPLEHDWLLFNLDEDIGETDNLAEAQPDRLLAMRENMEAYHASLGDIPPPRR